MSLLLVSLCLFRLSSPCGSHCLFKYSDSPSSAVFIQGLVKVQTSNLKLSTVSISLLPWSCKSTMPLRIYAKLRRYEPPKNEKKAKL